ncbi:hypothetical protein ViNHUV68_13840 [Vibrio sp. NH-UV-68]
MSLSNLKNISLYAMSLVLVKGMSLFTLPLMTHFLTPSEIGQLELLGITTVFLSLVVGLAMHENLYRFIGTIKWPKLRKAKAARLYSAALLISIGTSIALLGGYQLVVSTHTPFEQNQVLLIALVLCFEAPLAIGLAWLRLHNQARFFFKLCMLTVTAQVILLITVLYNQPDITTIFAVNVFCTFAQFLVLHRYLNFPFTWLSSKRLKHYLAYSAPLMLSGVVAFGLSGAERWIIAAVSDLTTLGLYAIAAKFSLAVGIAIQPFHMWWMPKRFEAMEKCGRDYVANTANQGMVLLCIISVVVCWMSQLFVTFAMPSAYSNAIPFIAITIIMMLFKEMVELTNFGLLYQRQTPQLLYINLASTMTALIVGIVTFTYGVYAILIALLIGQITRFTLVYYYSQKSIELNYSLNKIIGLLLLSSLFIMTSHLASHLGLSLLMLALQVAILIGYAIRCDILKVNVVREMIIQLQCYAGKAS